MARRKRRTQQQLDLPAARTWGGKRKGAGRKPAPEGKRHVPHRARRAHDPHCPVHVTIRARAGLPSLRQEPYEAIFDAICRSSFDGYRIIAFSVQDTHVHLMVEADENVRMCWRISGMEIRMAKAINRRLHRRGSVWDHRYHGHELETPTEVHNGWTYITQNWTKHIGHVSGLDGRSSARWNRIWEAPVEPPPGPCPVEEPRTWLASIGWKVRGGGLIRFGDRPAGAPRPAQTASVWAGRVRAGRAHAPPSAVPPLRCRGSNGSPRAASTGRGLSPRSRRHEQGAMAALGGARRMPWRRPATMGGLGRAGSTVGISPRSRPP